MAGVTQTDADIRLLFGVSMNGGPSGDSKELIRQDLQLICNELNKNPFKILFTADESALNNIKEQLVELTKTLNVTRLDMDLSSLSPAKQEIQEIAEATTQSNMQRAASEQKVTEAIKEKEAAEQKAQAVEKQAGEIAQQSASQIGIQRTSMQSYLRTYIDLLSTVNNNQNAVGMERFSNVSKYAQDFGVVYKNITEKDQSLSKAFSEFGKAADLIKKAKLELLHLKAEVEDTGQKGGVSIEQLANKILTMNNLLDKGFDKTGMSEEYNKLTTSMGKLLEAFNIAKQEGVSVGEAFKRMGINATQTLNDAAKNTAAYKLAVNGVIGATKQENTAETERQKVLSKSYSLLNNIQSAVKNWSAAANGKSAFEYSEVQKYANSLSNLISRLKNGKMSVEEFKESLFTIQNGFKSSAAVIAQNGENVKSFSDRLTALSRNFGMWISLSSMLMRAYRTIREMISASIELDDAMTQLKIVTGESEETYRKFGDTIARVAKNTASSISDITSSATVYARLGYSLEESAKIAEYTAKLQNVGDIDVADAQDAITSILKAYDDIDVNHIEDVMNKLITTGNHFPISVSQIAEGMNNASSALAAAGNTFEQSVALLTAANTTVNLCRVA